MTPETRKLRSRGWVTTRRWTRCWNCGHRTRTRKHGDTRDEWLCRPCQVTWITDPHGITKAELKATEI